MKTEKPLIVWFEDLTLNDTSIAGGKNASLGEMLGHLERDGIRVPPGFALTVDAYRHFLLINNLEAPIQRALQKLTSCENTLEQTGSDIRAMIIAGRLPEPLKRAIVEAYQQLNQRNAEHGGSSTSAVAVRSSATAEDLPEASFAGQQATYLNIRGEEALLSACQECYASLFTDRAISYRDAQGFDHLSVAISVGVQTMVHADTGAAGVMFTLDTETAFPDAVIISATWGLGEAVVQGRVIPDKYQIFKPLLKKTELSPIFEKSIGSKLEKLIYSDDGGTEWQQTSAEERNRQVLSDADILQLARWACLIEDHYGCAMDIEWAKDGRNGKLFILQARPETSASQKERHLLTTYQLKQKGELLLRGNSIGNAIATGEARVLTTFGSDNPLSAKDFPEGAILVAERTDPDWLPIMRRAGGVITDSGGPTSHAAIVCRELKIPAVVGTGNATTLLQQEQEITLSCASAAEGRIYNGILDFEEKAVDLSVLPHIDTQVMINMAIPGGAQQWWQLPIQGIGLVRIEYIISGLIRAHPMALLYPERLSDKKVRDALLNLSKGYPSPTQFFVSPTVVLLRRYAQ